MLQGLLAERFKLKAHREEKAVPGCALVVAPGGPKMRRVETWTPDDKAPVGADDTSAAPGDRPPSIFTALQEQLGLRLEPRKFPIQIVVVDHVQRIPTEN
jgi:hypothetical protein